MSVLVWVLPGNIPGQAVYLGVGVIPRALWGVRGDRK